MINTHKLIIKPFIEKLKSAYKESYGNMEPAYSNVIEFTASLALENISNCDALYHNVEHTIMVALAGQQILRGKHLIEGGVTPRDWLHYMMALMCHDIGYVKGICRGDKDGEYATGIDEQTVEIKQGGSCAVLAPYHVDRGKRFIKERFGGKRLVDVDVDTVISFIEMTRFPIPDDETYKETSSYAGLVRAADFIGQLGDPGYLRKIPALFFEFEETGANESIGYKTPEDMRNSYAKFYWAVVNPYIKNGLGYLHVTQEVKLWISNLHSHVFTVEHKEDTIQFSNKALKSFRD